MPAQNFIEELRQSKPDIRTHSIAEPRDDDTSTHRLSSTRHELTNVTPATPGEQEFIMNEHIPQGFTTRGLGLDRNAAHERANLESHQDYCEGAAYFHSNDTRVLEARRQASDERAAELDARASSHKSKQPGKPPAASPLCQCKH